MPVFYTMLFLFFSFNLMLNAVEITEDLQHWKLTGKKYSAVIDKQTGELLNINGKVTSGKKLWSAEFRNGKKLDSSNFHSKHKKHLYSGKRNGRTLELYYTTQEIDVEITVIPENENLDFQAEVLVKKGTVRKFALLPALKFSADDVRRVITFADQGRSIGSAWNSDFFRPLKVKQYACKVNPTAKRYQRLFGSGALMKDGGRSRFRAGKNGPEWLSPETLRMAEKISSAVGRPYAPGQADLELIVNDTDILLGASGFGGKGLLFRQAGWPAWLWGSVSSHEMLTGAFEDIWRKIAKEYALPARRKAAFIEFPRFPTSGLGGVDFNLLKTRFLQMEAFRDGKLEPVSLTTAEAVKNALQDPSILMVVNPYGEVSPLEENDMPQLKEFIRNGGFWFETGGYSFYWGMKEILRLQYANSYPGGAFADFNYFDLNGFQAALFGIQSHGGAPWKPEYFLIQTRTTIGSETNDIGFLVREHLPWISTGQKWKSPVTRLFFTESPLDAADAYCRANGLTRTIAEKAKPEMLETLRNAILLKVMGNLKSTFPILPKLPVPVLFHSADYLRGGFDKQYPDHLPPRPGFGTAAEFRRLIDELHRRGHLFMPYTNPTWWCINPKGPTFLAAGNDALAKDENGKFYFLQYGPATGYLTTLWHDSVRRANRKTLEAFLKEYPSDILFQDECGARGSRLDFNKAMPAPSANISAIWSMTGEDCRRIPLATEEGSAYLLNHELMFCGYESTMVPKGNSIMLRETRPDYVWSYFPLYQAMAHDKTILTMHDLASGVYSEERLAWALAWGYAINWSIRTGELADPAKCEWMNLLSAVQKGIVSRTFGKKLKSFRHEWSKTEAPHNSGYVMTQYGDTDILANLTPRAIVLGGIELPPYGFRAKDGGMISGSLPGLKDGKNAVFILLKKDSGYELSIFAVPGMKLNIPFFNKSGRLRVRGGTEALSVKNGSFEFIVPGKAKGSVRILQTVPLNEIQ